MGIQVKQAIELNPLKAKAAPPVEHHPQPTVSKPVVAKKVIKPALPIKRPRGRPQSGKETVTLRLSAKVVEHFKPHGKGWKQAIDAYLRHHLGL